MIIFSFHTTPYLLAKIPHYFHFTKTANIFLELKASFSQSKRLFVSFRIFSDEKHPLSVFFL